MIRITPKQALKKDCVAACKAMIRQLQITGIAVQDVVIDLKLVVYHGVDTAVFNTLWRPCAVARRFPAVKEISRLSK
jgi:hypothetical protein